MLEDKLRELRLLALDPREYDDRTVTLSQLDSLRRELIGAAKNNLKYVVFGKVGHRWSFPKSCIVRWTLQTLPPVYSSMPVSFLHTC